MDQVKKNGKIDIVFGCMFSGKTTSLLRKYRLNKEKRKKCTIIKYLDDTRYSVTGIATHDLTVSDKDVISCGKQLSAIEEKIKNSNVILIDEGQFYEDICEFSIKQAELGKQIFIVALDGTFERKPFGKILNLIPLADKVKKIHGVCDICHKNKSSFSKLLNDKNINNKDNIVIGGKDKYIATCRSCYEKNIDN